MTPRSQVIAALAVLLIGLVVVMALVGDAGVESAVFSVDATALPTATVTPVPTAIPGSPAESWPSPANWTMIGAGQLQYGADPAVSATVNYQTLPLDSLLPQMGVAVTADESSFPLLDALSQYRDGLLGQVDALGLDLDTETLTEGPTVDVIGGRPVVSLRLNFLPQLDELGNLAQGTQVLTLVDRSDDDVTVVSMTIEGTTNMYVEGDYWAWLDANMGDLGGPDEAADTGADDTGEDTTEGDTESDIESDTEADTGAEGDTEADTEAEADTDSGTEGDTEADTDTDTEAETDAGTDDSATNDSTTDTESSTDAEAESAGDADAMNAETDTETEGATDTTPDTAGQDDAAAAAADGPWMEVGAGQMIYATNPNVMVLHGSFTSAEIAAGLGVESSEDAPLTPIELLDAMKTGFQTQYEEALGVPLEDAAFTGPANVTYGDVQMAELGVSFEAITDPATGQEIPQQMSRQFMIDLGRGNIYFVQFVAQGEFDPVALDDFETWLDENAATFTAPEPEAGTEADTETDANTDAGTDTGDETDTEADSESGD